MKRGSPDNQVRTPPATSAPSCDYKLLEREVKAHQRGLSVLVPGDTPTSYPGRIVFGMQREIGPRGLVDVIARHDRMALLIENVAGNRRVTLLCVGDPIIPVDEQPLPQLDRVVVQLDKAAIPVRILGGQTTYCGNQVAAVVRKHPDAKEVPLSAI